MQITLRTLFYRTVRIYVLHTSDPAELPKYWISPELPRVKVPSASIDLLVAGLSSSLVVACLALIDSEPNLTFNNSSVNSGCLSSDTVDCKIARASSSCRMRLLISYIFSCNCSVSARINLQFKTVNSMRPHLMKHADRVP